MPFFIDTSALFKRYQPEKGTAAVTRILEDRSQPLYREQTVGTLMN
jgi:hypothetical protein